MIYRTDIFNEKYLDSALNLFAENCRAEESIKAAMDTGVETYVMEIRLIKDTLDNVKRDVEFIQKLIG